MHPHPRVIAAGLLVALSAIGCNGPPEGGEIRLEPADPFSSDDLALVVIQDFVDPNGDALELQIVWTRDGELVELEDDFVVPAALTTKDEVWSVQVTASDGRTLGPSRSSEVTVRNAPPKVDSVALSPAAPTVQDAIRASVSASDADGDPVQVTVRWEVDGRALPGEEGEILRAGKTVRGEHVTAVVSVEDGELAGTDVRSEPVQIVNTPPSLAGANVEPGFEVYADSTLDCFALDWQDPDGDAPDYVWEWLVDGAVVGSGQSLEGAFSAGDRVSCRVTPYDGIEHGEPVTSDPVTIEEGSIYDCDPPAAMPAEPFAGVSIDPATVQIEATLGYDRGSARFRSWCAADGSRPVAIDVLIIGEAYASSGSLRDVCALRLVPTSDTVAGARVDFDFDFRLGNGSRSYTHYGLTLREGSFTVQDRRYRADSGTVGSCLARTFPSPWPRDISTLFTDKDWSVSMGAMAPDVLDSLREADTGDPDDPYQRYQDGYVFGVGSGSTDTVGIGPLGYGQAYAVDTLYWTVQTDTDGQPERMSATDALPAPGAHPRTGIYTLAPQFVWIADRLLEP